MLWCDLGGFMRSLYLILLVVACAKNSQCPNQVTYFSENSQHLTLGCGKMAFYRPSPKCYLNAAFDNRGLNPGLPGYNVLWELKQGSCYYAKPLVTLCYLDLDFNHHTQVELSCPELGIHSLFKKTI